MLLSKEEEEKLWEGKVENRTYHDVVTLTITSSGCSSLGIGISLTLTLKGPS